MKIFLLAVATLSVANATEQSSLHLRIHNKGGACTITNESQCDGQNWTGSTCCADSNYECRWSDDGQNVKRCQKKWGKGQHHKAVKTDSDENDFDIDVDASDVADALGIDPEDYDDWSDWFGSDDSSDYEDDESGSDDVTKRSRQKGLTKGGACTITNESQCDGQNWTGSRCCADSELRVPLVR